MRKLMNYLEPVFFIFAMLLSLVVPGAVVYVVVHFIMKYW